MRESRTYGSVRGARGNSRPYRDRQRNPGAALPFGAIPDFAWAQSGLRCYPFRVAAGIAGMLRSSGMDQPAAVTL